MDVQLQSTLEQIAGELSLDVSQVAAVVQLLDDGNTVPFITRYRKEQTGNLDEVKIREIEQRIHSRRQLIDKAETILRLIDSQGKLTPELRRLIEATTTLKRLDDLYRPYRPKRKSRAIAARQQGLEPLAHQIRDGSAGSLPTAAVDFINAELGVEDAASAVSGACDIIAEWIGEDVSVRELARKLAWRTGKLTVVAGNTAGNVAGEFQDYIGFSDQVWKIPPHRILALNRGEKSSVLRVRFEWDRKLARHSIAEHFTLADHPHASVMTDVIRDSVERLIHPSIERELRRELTEQSEKQAVGVFSRNLRSLLLQPPLRNERVVAIDPGFRTG
ncbi:MAG: Tex-like N-terminal domain-containing protein, partial [Planctomycetaceae bacterium]